MIDIMFARVSSDDQDERSQITSMISKFGLVESDCLVLNERMSAWNQDKEYKRLEFLKLKSMVKNRQVRNIYVFDIDRIYRNRVKLVEFYSFCKHYDVKIFSHNQEYLNALLNIEMPGGLEFLGEQIFSNTLNLLAWTAEDESNKKSQRVKSKIKVKDDGAYSVYGNKWGRKSLSKQTVSKVLEFSAQGLSVRKIAELVKTSDKNNNMKNISKSVVHKIIHDFISKKVSNCDGVHKGLIKGQQCRVETKLCEELLKGVNESDGKGLEK